jgi:hypothetical protein
LKQLEVVVPSQLEEISMEETPLKLVYNAALQPGVGSALSLRL